MSAKSLYKALLRCYPSAFRDEYGSQMLLVFSEQLSELQRSGGRLQAVRLWWQAAMDALTVAPLEHCHVILQDLRYTFRTLATQPAFTAVAFLSLALGIGADTAIFSLWNGVLHAWLPGVLKPEDLVVLTNPDSSGSWTGTWDTRTDGDRAWLTYSEFEQLRDHTEVFSALMASQSGLDDWPVRVDSGAGPGDWEVVHGRMVSGRFFQVLGVDAAIGRVFTTAEDHSDLPYAVISYDYWQRRFAGRPDVLGRTVGLRKVATTIIGVTPRGFVGESSGQRPDLWLPLRLQPRVMPDRDRLHDTPPEKSMWLQVFGRLQSGVTRARAEVQANAVFRTGLESFYGQIASERDRRALVDQRLRIRPGGRGVSETRVEYSHSLTALLAAVVVLLLISSANLANLLLARGAVRRPEISLRLSLGASRGRLIRQLVTESLTLAMMGGATGLVAAYFLHGALVRMMTQSDPDFHMSFSLDPLVLAFATATTLVAALLFGVLPACQLTKADVGATLKEHGRTGASSFGRMRWGRYLVILQLALSLPLLVGAGLLARTLYNLQRLDLGYPAQRLLVVRVDTREAADTDARRNALLTALRENLRRIPGVPAVTYSGLGLFSGGESTSGIAVEGYVPRTDHDRSSPLDVVGPRYFSTLGVPLLRGREILESDHEGAPAVCVINEEFAKRFFDGRNPIGMRITSTGRNDKRTTYVVVGIARNARTQKLRGEVVPRYFIPAAQTQASAKSPFFLIRTAAESAPVLAAVRQSIQTVDATLPIPSAESIEDRMAPLTAQDRTTAQLALVFGGIALTLAAVGLYGVISYGITRRTGEIAVRIALGAQPRRVISMILRETMGLVAAGLALGAALAYAASRLIHSRLYGVAPQDPLTLTLATGLLLLVALSAAYLPAQRTSKLDPMTALRQE